jgi:hypothetical protein
MKLFSKIVLVFFIFAAVSVIFFSWYAVQHKMDEAPAHEFTETVMQKSVLIATEGSKFKEAVVEATVAQLKTLPVYVKVIDIDELARVNETEWAAIVILETKGHPLQKEIHPFVERVLQKNKIIVVTAPETEFKNSVEEDTPPASEAVKSNASNIVHRIKSILDL